MTTTILTILLAMCPIKSDVARAVDAKKTMRERSTEAAQCVGCRHSKTHKEMQMDDKFPNPFNMKWGDYIVVTPWRNAQVVTFKIQNGPIKEVGENGAQIDSMIMFAEYFLRYANSLGPCHETKMAISHLEQAQTWLAMRTARRMAEGTEGTSK